ncbi:WD40 repeat domain-containing serine/threonine protein kinase [Herbidospora cretacea]|uniref:WD40 repeat domain-containing serine/threonine protein kinase n=1 Tax=Herbidospora cretacea TaxID=28444 RepID=UPI000A5ECAE6|nr:serine/threonine-protein kinase [Herbidospora cretacea]
MPVPRPLRPGDPRQVGSYTLNGLIGEGGQGTVFHGHTEKGESVAVKVLHARVFSRRDFHNEVAAARRVAQFCTARVIDADVTGERPFIVSEYVDGESLEALVRREGPRDAGSLDRLAVGTAAALAAIHKAGIVHRDFKPANILLGADGPRVIDFGIAQVVDAAGTEASRVQGTPAYMSPEQLAGRRPGPPSDVFSWGVTMTFAATGRPAFGNDSIPAVMNRIITREPDLSYVPSRLRDVLASALAKDPADRPTAADLLVALVHAHDEGHQAEERSGRRRWVLVGAAALLVGAGAISFLPEPAPRPVVTVAPMSLPVDAGFGQPVGAPFGGHKGEVLSVAAGTLDSRPVVVSAGRDGTTRLSDLTTGAAIGRARPVDALSISSVTVARDMVVCGGYGAGVWLSDLKSGRAIPFRAKPGDVLALGVTTLGEHTAVVTTGPESVRVTDLASGRTLLKRGGGATAVAFTIVEGRDVAVTATLDGRAEVWDLSTGETVGAPFPLPGELLAVSSVDARPVVVTADGNALHVFDLQSGTPLGRPYSGHTDRVSALATTELNGRPVAVSGSWDGTVRVWDLVTGTPVGSPLTGHRGWVTSVAVTLLDGSPVVVAGGRDGTVRSWRL